MDCVRVTVQTAQAVPKDKAIDPFSIIDKEIEDWWKTFFTSSVEVLMKNLSDFFEEHDNSPFPVVAHVIPPQDSSDSACFVESMLSLKIPFFDKKIHHIQHEKMILFNSASPPSNVPRVLSIFSCFNANQLFEEFVLNILMILFKFGISPENSFIGIIRSLYFDKYRSFSYLITIIRQSILEHITEKHSTDFTKFFESDAQSYIPHFLKQSSSNQKMPNEARIKIRINAINLSKALLNLFEIEPFIFAGVSSFDEIYKGSNYTKLLSKIRTMDQEVFKKYLEEETHELCSMFSEALIKKEESPAPAITRAKSRHSRQMAILGMSNDNDKSLPVNVLDSFFANAFKQINEKSPNIFKISGLGTFDPRNDLLEMLQDPKTDNDTAIAYQILNEQEAKTVNVADWLNAFSARINIKNKKVDDEDKAITLSRFQVSVSELEYLGFVDKRTRKPGTFRRIIRV